MKRPFFIVALILALLIPLFRLFHGEDSFAPGHISYFVSEKPRYLAVKGTIVSDPLFKCTYFKEGQDFILRAQFVKVADAWRPVYGNIRVTSYGEEDLEYGDDILSEAKLKVPSSGGDIAFDYRVYLARKGIYAVAVISDKDALIVTGNKAYAFRRGAYRLKDLIKERIERIFRPPERYFLAAVLLGERHEIPAEWRELFARTQTMHMLAISGLHVGLITFIVLAFFGILRVPRNPRLLLTIFFMIFYAIMVGGRPSVIRATVMAVVVLGSYALKRNADIYNSLGLAAVLILVYNPDGLFDTGFILSFVSVLSIVYLTPRFNRWFHFDRIEKTTFRGRALSYVSSLGTASLSVWLCLMPFTAYFFGIISPVSVLVNIIAIPVLFAIIALSISALMFHPVIPFLGILLQKERLIFTRNLCS